MIDANGFVIENGVLTKYYGTDTDIVIPETVTTIGEYAFERCASLKSVTIPDYVTNIENDAFWGCTGLQTFIMHPGCTADRYFVYVGGEPAGYDINFLCCCSNLEYLFLPDNVITPVYSFSPLNYKPGVGLHYMQQCRWGISEELRVISRGVPITKVPSDKKEPYLRGFLEFSKEYPEEIAKEYLTYLGRMIKKWQPLVIENTKALECVLQNRLIKKTMVDEWLEKIQQTGDAERTTMMMNYMRENFGIGFEEYSDRIESREKEEKKRELQKKNAEKKKQLLEEKRKDPNADLKTVWTIKKFEKECRLSNYKGNAEVLIIPETYEGLKITEIYKSHKDKGYDSVKKIVLPDTVEILWENCFSYCENLESIELGKGITYIGTAAFNGCGKLEEIVVPEGVHTIKKWTFRDCKNLKKIVFENKRSVHFETSFNFVGGADRAKLYFHKGTRLSGLGITKKRIVIIEDQKKP